MSSLCGIVLWTWAIAVVVALVVIAWIIVEVAARVDDLRLMLGDEDQSEPSPDLPYPGVRKTRGRHVVLKFPTKPDGDAQ